jgi:hypothetical protein
MNSDDFEKRLQRVPLRQIPSEWRDTILKGATTSRPRSPASRRSLLSTINSGLSTLLWPNPKAWAGLAAVWVLIFVLNREAKEGSPMMAAVSTSSSETVAALKDQQKILVELIGSNEPQEIDKPRHFPPWPHSERRTKTSMV